MFRTIGRILMILVVASVIGGIIYLLVQALGAQSTASAMQQFGGGRDQSASLAGLGQVVLNAVEAGVIIGIVYPLQRWWLGHKKARMAQTRRVMAATH